MHLEYKRTFLNMKTSFFEGCEREGANGLCVHAWLLTLATVEDCTHWYHSSV